jgi:hypothetical protein
VTRLGYCKPSLILGAAIAALAFSGCGYHFASSGDALPPSAETIYVSRFNNNTRITGVNDEFMRYVKDEIAMHRRLTVVDSPDNADLELTGEVRLTNQSPSNFNSALEPTSYRNNMTVSAVLKDLRGKKVIWSTHSVGSSQTAPVVAQTVVSTTPTFLQGNLRGGDIRQLTDLQTAQVETAEARDLMMQRLAKSLYVEMAEGF